MYVEDGDDDDDEEDHRDGDEDDEWCGVYVEDGDDDDDPDGAYNVCMKVMNNGVLMMMVVMS